MHESKRHIVWAQGLECNGELATTYEYCERNGDVYRAPLSSVVMPDGYRVGRWECSLSMWARYKDMLLKQYSKVWG
jgi:hypothetical protein